MVMTGAVCMDLLGHSVSYLLSWSRENSSSLLPGGYTLLAARVWVAEWRKKARGLNIAYKVLALFLLSVCSQNRNPAPSPENRPSLFDQVERESGV